MSDRGKGAWRIWLPIVGVVMVILAVWAAARLRPIEVLGSASDDQPLISFVGNSFVGGSSMDSGATFRWPSIVAREVGAAAQIITAGSSGYVTPGELMQTYPELAKRISPSARAVVFLGSDDDANRSFDEIRAGALDAFATARARAPEARLLVIATFWVDDDPPAGILNSRDAVRAAAAQAGVAFVDPIADGWLVNDPAITIGSDGLHPTDAGHSELAARIEPLLAQLLAPTG
ncbi:MAG: SGNH/GDSL hydrolase family protein [Microbacteriaceae bacterium]